MSEEAFTTSAVDMPTLTLAGMRAAIDDFHRRFPLPDVWIYGIEMGPLGGPLGVSAGEAAWLIASGWAYFEGPTGRVYWTQRAWSALRSLAQTEGAQHE